MWFANHRQTWLNDWTVIPTRSRAPKASSSWRASPPSGTSSNAGGRASRCSRALTAEITIFLVTNLVVARPRPDVFKLDSVPATSSYPSGHVAATFALYGSLALIATLRHANKPRIVLQWLFTIVAVALVAFARVYRGAHHISDVVAGAALGIVCVIAAEHLAFRVAEWLRERGNVAEGSDFA